MATSTAAAGHPHLSPQFCFSTGALKEFLRLSRSVDDTISQSLNTLSTPSRTPFDPTLTARLSPHRLPASACTQFTQRVLFPSWQARTAVLEYCGRVAEAEDPMDPAGVAVAAAAAAERVVDERLDPYSGRYYPKERRTEVLAAVVRGERGVEEIVRERSWRVVGERCEGVGQREGRGWRAAFEEWGAGRG
ncbi:caffeine-induced death protein 2-domain-containing protein [Morchella snyderi]|nr:caffeine-induced death protein 2-domain-containing protein [Morchella snyderi]